MILVRCMPRPVGTRLVGGILGHAWAALFINTCGHFVGLWALGAHRRGLSPHRSVVHSLRVTSRRQARLQVKSSIFPSFTLGSLFGSCPVLLHPRRRSRKVEHLLYAVDTHRVTWCRTSIQLDLALLFRGGQRSGRPHRVQQATTNWWYGPQHACSACGSRRSASAIYYFLPVIGRTVSSYNCRSRVLGHSRSSMVRSAAIT